MERKKTFGQEVKFLRKRRGWSQKDLAYNILGMSPRTLGKIERGEKPFLDHTMVSQLADALHLEGLTREEFFSQAGLNEGTLVKDLVQPQTDEATVHTFYHNIKFPAYIHDSLFTLRSANSSMLGVFGVDLDDYKLELFAPSGPHILRQIFEIQFEARTNWTKDKAWRDHVEMLIYRFRVLSRKHAANQQHIDLVTQLKKYPEFNTIWQKIEKTDYVPHFPTMSTFHLKTGEELIFVMTVATDSAFVNAEANKVIFIPANEATRAYLNHMADHTPYFYLLFDQNHPDGFAKFTPSAG